MAGGRPRTVSPDREQCIQLGEELVGWVAVNNPTHLSEWFSIEKMIPWKTWNAMCELPEFLPYYEQALSLVARNARNGTLHPSLAQRFLSLYHRDLKKEERDTAEFESKLKSQEVTSLTEEMVSRHEAMMNQISSLQSERKIADKSKSKDQ
jgi:hypothetical protein